MGLSKKSVDTAIEILHKISPEAAKFGVVDFNNDTEFTTDRVLGYDYKGEGCFENICMNIKDITPAQQQMWEDLNKAVPNTSYMRHKVNGITRIGWI